VTREEMLHAEVARKLSNSGVDEAGDQARELVRSMRNDVAALLLAASMDMASCEGNDCLCVVAALVYQHLSQEVADGGEQ